jgi:hypothetical protein
MAVFHVEVFHVLYRIKDNAFFGGHVCLSAGNPVPLLKL